MAHCAFSTNRQSLQTVLYDFMGHLGHDVVSEIQYIYGKYGSWSPVPLSDMAVFHIHAASSAEVWGLEKSRLLFIDI
jgi:hypothetical protein